MLNKLNQGIDSLNKGLDDGMKTMSKNVSNMTKAATKTGKLISKNLESAFDPGKDYGPLWENVENISYCRGCNRQFDLLLFKHHCRKCAGIFCDDCLEIIDNKKDELVNKQCNGCRKGEIIGDDLKKTIRKILEKELSDPPTSKDAKSTGILDSSFMLNSKNFISSPAAINLTLERGSCYNEYGTEHQSKHNRAKKGIPISGYFEILNKSDKFIAVKLLYAGGNLKFESTKPSYFVIPPKHLMNTFFDPSNKNGLELILLTGNPNPTPPSDKRVVYDTRSAGVLPELISPCAQISEFRNIMFHRIPSCAKNVLLKYKIDDISGADGTIIPRSGNSISRIGLLNRLQGKRFAVDKLDYSTNVTSIESLKRFTCIK